MKRFVLALTFATAGVLAAQDPPSQAGRISYLSGAVSFAPAGVDQWVAATVNRPLTIGDQLFADNGARAEVHVPGAAFHLGERAAFEFLNLDDQTVQVRLSEGTLDLRVRNLHGTLEVDTPNLAFTVSRPGEYRLDTNPENGQSLVTVRDGEGQVTSTGGAFSVHAGQQAVVTGQDQSAQYQINGVPGLDAFDNWVISRNRREDRYSQSRYVSTAVVGYEDLGEYGTWRAAPGYGEVWVPNGVRAGWAPYQDGHWAWVDPWGWTWVDDAAWGFAPFHYGRWAYVGGYWGWCPGPVAVAPVYAPALVAWVGFGGGFGASIGFGAGPAVGWFPLGPRDVYIPAFTASSAYVTRINVRNTTVINTVNVTNVYNTYVRTGSVPVNTYMNRSVPGAVMAAPQSALTGAQSVRQVARRIQPNQLGSINTAAVSPRVAPQVSSVLGRPAGGNVPRPPAAVLNRPVMARATPPPAPPSFQRRQTELAKNPGRPLAVAQLHQLASTAPPAAAVRPPVRVVSGARPITPQSATARVPANVPPVAPPRSAMPQRSFEPATQQRPSAPQAAQPQRTPLPPRTFQPPAAQPQRQATPQVVQPQPQRTPVPPRSYVPPAAQPQRPQAPPRSYSPPAAQPQRSPEPPRTYVPPAAQPQRSPAPPRSYSPPAAQPQRSPEPPRTYVPPAAQPQRSPAPPRSYSPPAAQPQRPQAPQPRQSPPVPQAPPPVRDQPRVQAPPRPAAPPTVRQVPPPAREQPRAQPQPHPAAPPHPAPPPPERKKTEPHG